MEDLLLQSGGGRLLASDHQTEGSLLALKKCKTGLGKRGKGVKSYFLKTSLYWLCQEIPSDEWGSATEGARRILDFLESAVDAHHLPCFFWAEIDVFRFLSPGDMAAMRTTIRLLRDDMERLLMRWCAGSMAQFVTPILRHPEESDLPERDLRICVARALIKFAIRIAFRKQGDSPLLQRYSSLWVPRLLASSAATELETMHHRALSTTFLQTTLFRALLAAPEDILGRTRLTLQPDGLYSLDPTPLVSLLGAQDVLELLGKPLNVLFWCHLQHKLPLAERPAGVPYHINTPRGFCDLALRPSLLRRALCESVPGFRARLQADESWDRQFSDRLQAWHADMIFVPDLEVYERRVREKYADNVRRRLVGALGLDEETARDVESLWWSEMCRVLADPAERGAFRRKCSSLPDTWLLRKYVFSGRAGSSAKEA